MTQTPGSHSVCRGLTTAGFSPSHQGWGRLAWAGDTASCPPSQTGEYATDEDEELSPTFPGGEMAIEVFELAENEDALSPVDMEPEKLVHKFKEVRRGAPGLVEGKGRLVFSAAALPAPARAECLCPRPHSSRLSML